MTNHRSATDGGFLSSAKPTVCTQSEEQNHSIWSETRLVKRTGQWYKVWLVGAEQEATALRAALWREGHDLRTAWDDEGNVFLAARVYGDAPASELRRLFDRAEVSGGFQPLPVSRFGNRPCGVELGPLPVCAGTQGAHGTSSA
jgi:hypothetical protein